MSELDKLERYLKEHGYKNTRTTKKFPDETIALDQHPEEMRAYSYLRGVPWHDQIIVYDEKGNRLWDAVCHYGSYGSDIGLIEVMGAPVTEKDVEGWLTADEIIKVLEGRRDGDDDA